MQMDLIPVNPESVGFSFDRLRQLDKLCQNYIESGNIAGISLTVAREGKTVYLGKYGWMDREAGKQIRFDTIFKIASMSKPVTAVAAMMLFEEGFFNLNTPISKFIPEFNKTKVVVGWDHGKPILSERKGEITFRHLFTHTSGLSYSFYEGDPISELMQKKEREFIAEGTPLTNTLFTQAITTFPLAFQPGSHWRYGCNIEILGSLIETISGETLDCYLAKRIFQPLKMLDTGFYVPPEKVSRVSGLYGHPDGSETLQRRYPDEIDTELPTFQSGGGGLYSTLPDYARFCQMLVNEGELEGIRLLSPKTTGMFRVNHAPLEALPYGFVENDSYHAGYGFGLGMRVLMDPSASGIVGSIGEFGWDGAYNTYFWIDPIENLYGLMMLQHFPNAYYPIAQQFKTITYAALIEPTGKRKKSKKKK